MVKEDLIAEWIAIAAYTEIITWLGSGDPTTRRVLEQILASEEEHAEDMLTLCPGKFPLPAAPGSWGMWPFFGIVTATPSLAEPA